MTLFELLRLALLTAGMGLAGWALARLLLNVHDLMTLLPLSLALGLLGYILLLDVLAYALPVHVAAWLAALLPPLTGGAALWFRRRTLPPLKVLADRRVWWALLAVMLLLFVAQAVLALELYVFDDASHLHIMQIINEGAFPARYQWNPDYAQGNHYGVYLLGVGGAQVAGLGSWYALDLYAALIAVVAPWLAFAYGYRLTGSVWAGAVGALLFYTASGARWLALPFMPAESASPWLGVYDVNYLRFGLDSTQLLQFPMIFRSGNYNPFLLIVHTKVQAAGWLGAMTLLLLGTLDEAPYRARSVVFAVVLGMFGLLYLTNPLSLGPGLALAWLYTLLRERDAARRRAVFPLDLRIIVPLALLLFALLGGYPTDRLFGGPGAFGPAEGGNAMALGLRSELALPNFDFGTLPLLGTPLVVFLFELGFAPLWLPLAAWGLWRDHPAQRWVLLASVAGALLMLVIGIPGAVWDADTVRIGGLGFPLMALLGGVIASERWPRLRVGWRALIVGGVVVTSLSGVLLMMSMLTRLTGEIRPTHYIEPLDEAMMAYGDQVPAGALMFDPTDFRSGATVFGAYTRHITSRQDHLTRRDAYVQQKEAPTLDSLRADGYGFVYVTRGWYESLLPEGRAVLDGMGFILVGEMRDPASGDWRRLLRVCLPQEDCPGAGPPFGG